MKNINVDYVQNPSMPPLLAKLPFWPVHVRQDIDKQCWSKTCISEQINLTEWQSYLDDLPKDPYVETRWKSMSWLYFNESNELKVLDNCPMAQGGAYNDADTMANKLRHYPALDKNFLARDDVQEFVKAWAGLWRIDPNEPILMQITGVKGKQSLDPLQGQGIHQDGSKFLSILVLNRDNVTGGVNTIYKDKAGEQIISKTILAPGEILHIQDDEVFHHISSVQALDQQHSFERFIIIINARFNDTFQNRILRQHFADAVLDNG